MKNSSSNTTMISCLDSNSSIKSVDIHQDDDQDSLTGGSLQWTLKQWFGVKNNNSSSSSHDDSTACSPARKPTCQLSKPNDKLNRLVSFYL